MEEELLTKGENEKKKKKRKKTRRRHFALLEDSFFSRKSSLLSFLCSLLSSIDDNAHRSRPPRLPWSAGGAGPRGARGRGTFSKHRQSKKGDRRRWGSLFLPRSQAFSALFLASVSCSDVQRGRDDARISSESGPDAGAKERVEFLRWEARRGRTNRRPSREREEMPRIDLAGSALCGPLSSLSREQRIVVIVIYSTRAINRRFLCSQAHFYLDKKNEFLRRRRRSPLLLRPRPLRLSPPPLSPPAARPSPPTPTTSSTPTASPRTTTSRRPLTSPRQTTRKSPRSFPTTRKTTPSRRRSRCSTSPSSRTAGGCRWRR